MIFTELMNKYSLEQINSFTKYPSILTYHKLGQKGMLTEEFEENKNFKECNKCYITEKIDGTNSRIILLNDDYLIGSRENFLYSKGDRFGNPALNIVNVVKPLAEKLCNENLNNNMLYMIYGETYGGTVTASSKQYTNNKSYGFRIFDIAVIDIEEFENVLKMPVEKISFWREHGGQKFLNVSDMQLWIKKFTDVDTVPYITECLGKDIPLNRNDVLKWLEQFSTTNSGINNYGKAEGVVIRNFDRSIIRKIRFEDYERTKKKGGF